MKTFLKFREELKEAAAAGSSKEYVPTKDTDDEVKDYKPRSKGEEKFKKVSDTDKIAKHPVATDDNFKAKTDSKSSGEKHIGGKKHAKGEAPVMQGNSKIKEALDLSNTGLTGKKLSELKTYLSGLKDVKVSGNKVTGNEETILKALDKHGVS